MLKESVREDYLTWAEIDLDAIKYNLRQIRRLASRNRFFLPSRHNNPSKTKEHKIGVLAVIKADAYGHGMVEVAKLLDEEGVESFAVSNVSEGVRLRKIGIKKPILLFETTLPIFVRDICHYSLMPTVTNLDFAEELNRYAYKIRRNVYIHIQVDTGMGRFGIWHEDAYDFIRKIMGLRRLIIYGIYTHFPVADKDRRFTLRQVKDLYNLVVRLDKSGFVIPFIHASNSMGLAGYRTDVLNLVRPGLMLYGLYPHPRLRKDIKLKPALSVKSKVIYLQKISKGRGISYGRTFIAEKDMIVATIPIGYNDGYLRCLSNKAYVLIKGVRCAVLGRVTMDEIVVDVSKIISPQSFDSGSRCLRLGSLVTLVGRQGKEEISADELAQYADTINYEIVCSLGNRLPRVYKKR